MTRSRSKALQAFPVLAALAFVPLTACGDDPAGVEFEVIEEVEFAASLGIDLSQMERLGNGVYRQDLVDGMGDALVAGTRARVDHQGWLRNGTPFSAGVFEFPVGADSVVVGFEEGLLGMLEGGTRRLIIPPALGYGARGSGPVPPGAIMVFEVDLLDIS